ncbi:MAG: NAD(P)-dependent alcohol dehydrogenase [Phenylobacterium sp.]|nr:MAG: NAD(P)-dependent alcohol dehydrogenase [Phenylobacterium sp.]
MRAAVVTRYGPPEAVQVRQVPKPVPAAGELLIRVHAATVNRTDCGELNPRVFGRLVFGLRRPRRTTFGFDVAGVVEAVGAGVTAFRPGDRVFGMCPYRRNGAQADYVVVPETAPLALIPAGLGFAQAVVCEGAYYANSGLQQFDVGPAHSILVYGASGAIGSAAVQLAKARGAHVTAVVATRHLDLARSLGADRVIDYTADEFRRLDARFDFVFEAVGKTSYFRWRRLLKPGGRFMATDIGPWGHYLPLLLASALTKTHRVTVPLPRRGSAPAFVAFMRARLAASQFHAPIDRTYPLEAIADAYRYVMSGQKAGIVVIDVAGSDG